MCSTLHITTKVSFQLLKHPTPSQKGTGGGGGNKPVLDRRCICVFCFEVRLAPAALEADLAFVVVVVAVAMLTCDAFRCSPWWFGGRVDICILCTSRGWGWSQGGRACTTGGGVSLGLGRAKAGQGPDAQGGGDEGGRGANRVRRKGGLVLKARVPTLQALLENSNRRGDY